MYGLCPLILNWFFLEEASSSSLGDKTISLLMFTPTIYVPQKLNIAFNIGLTKRTDHKAGLK